MKKSRIIICSFIIFISSITFASSFLANNFFTNNFPNSIVNTIKDTNFIDDWINSLNIDFSTEKSDKMNQLQKKITNDDSFTKIVNDLSTLLIEDILTGSPSQIDQLENDTKSLLKSYASDFATLSDDNNINPTLKETLIKTLINNIDFQPIYNTAVKKAQSDIDPSQLNTLQTVYTLGSPRVMYTSSIIIILSIAIAIFLTKSIIKSLSYIYFPLIGSGCVIFLIGLLLKFYLNSILEQSNIQINPNIAFSISFIYIFVSIILFLIKKFSLNKKRAQL